MIVRDLLVLNEARLPEVLLALLLLLGLVVGDVGGVAPLVVGVIALNLVVVFSLLHHLHLVDAPLPVISRPGSSNLREVWRSLVSSLTLGTTSKRLGSNSVICMVTMMVSMSMVMVLCTSIGIEREGVHQRLAISGH